MDGAHLSLLIFIFISQALYQGCPFFQRHFSSRNVPLNGVRVCVCVPIIHVFFSSS